MRDCRKPWFCLSPMPPGNERVACDNPMHMEGGVAQGDCVHMIAEALMRGSVLIQHRSDAVPGMRHTVRSYLLWAVLGHRARPDTGPT